MYFACAVCASLNWVKCERDSQLGLESIYILQRYGDSQMALG
jgi:hypothetical protein